MSTTTTTPAYSVTHPAIKSSTGDRYVLGLAKTAIGAVRCLRRVDRNVRAAMLVRLHHSAGPLVWEPK